MLFSLVGFTLQLTAGVGYISEEVGASPNLLGAAAAASIILSKALGPTEPDRLTSPSIKVLTKKK